MSALVDFINRENRMSRETLEIAKGYSKERFTRLRGLRF